MSATMTQEEEEVSMGFIERSLVYPETMFHIVTRMLEYMKNADDYVSTELLDMILERVEWARKRGDQPRVAFLVFWKLYTTWMDFQEMVHDSERAYNPLQSTARDFLHVATFATQTMDQLCSSAFMPCNIQKLLLTFQRHMDAGLNLRMPAVLQSEPLDPVRVDKECPMVDPVELLPSWQAREMTRNMRRCIHAYGKELSSRELLDDHSGDGDTRKLAIHVSPIDPLIPRDGVF